MATISLLLQLKPKKTLQGNYKKCTNTMNKKEGESQLEVLLWDENYIKMNDGQQMLRIMTE